ncbi:MAG: bacillithiol biosynthesis cysteine-adding enzyme BshC [Deltaproteobacteria bacterium]|nr:bacillithiol biosynthesis cysteine-adding enzyme BshC [Deltaproteobacteria bacterium]
MSRPFAPTWLAGDSNARALLPGDLLDRAGRRAVAHNAAARTIHPGALQAARELAAQLPDRPARTASLQRLAQGGTAVVVTGQQLGLWLGPLFTLHKAATAVAAARALEAETGVPTVPLFWLQSEDHDAAEIDHAWVPRPPGAPVRLHAPLDGAGRASVGSLQTSPRLLEVLNDLDGLLHGLPHADATLALLRDTWRPGEPLGLAVARHIDALLGDHGLVLVDPRHPAMVAAAAPLHRQVVERHSEIEELLHQRGAELRAAGFEPQVAVRPGSPLCFVAPAGDGTPRYRLRAQGDGWQVLRRDGEQSLTDAELRALPAAAFSTSALLRPLLQDLLLPSAAYVGGPAELGYLAQIQPVYPLLGIPPSCAVGRAGFTWLEGWLQQALAEQGLTIADLQEVAQLQPDRAALHQQAQAEADTLHVALNQALDSVWPQLQQALAQADPGLDKAGERARAQIDDTLVKLLGKMVRARSAQGLGDASRWQRAQVLCWPQGLPQERFYSWPWFAARFGVEALTHAALSMPEPFAGQHCVEAL